MSRWPCRDEAPHLKGSEKGQGRGRGTSCTRHAGSASGRILRHVVGHLPAPALDVPVPHQLPDIEHFAARLIHRLSTKILLDVPIRGSALRSWWNSWWKSRRPFLTLRYCGLWSSTSTFQFLVVEAPFLVFMVFSQDTSLPSRKRISERIVEHFVDPVSSPGEGVFRTFPQIRQSSALQLMDGGGSAGGHTTSTQTHSRHWQPPPGVKVVWNGERNEEGLVWYWHSTRVSTFDLPPLPPGRGAVPPAQGCILILGGRLTFL